MINDMSLTSSDRTTLKDEVREFFRRYSTDCFPPKQVSQRLGLNYSTVKNYCNTLSKEDYLIRVGKGIYQWKGRLTRKQLEGIMEGLEPLFHGLQYVITGGEGDGMTSSNNLPENPFKDLGMGDRCRRVKWQIENNAILCSVKCTSDCLSIMEFISFNSWLIGYFPSSKIELRNVGINKDLLRIRLEGLKGATMYQANNVLFRAYNKNDSLRLEHHCSGSVSLKDVLEIGFKFDKEILEIQNRSKPIPNLIDHRKGIRKKQNRNC